jgi:hypothetical protein
MRAGSIWLVVLVAVIGSGCTAFDRQGHSETETVPPKARLVVVNRSVAMATGSYCWSDASAHVTGCGDSMPFADYPGLPAISLHDGARVTLVLGFMPNQPVRASLDGGIFRLPAATRSTFSVHGHGILQIDARAGAGDVSYGVRVRTRP